MFTRGARNRDYPERALMVIWIMIMLVLVMFNIIAVDFYFPTQLIDLSRAALFVIALILLIKGYKNMKSRFN